MSARVSARCVGDRSPSIPPPGGDRPGRERRMRNAGCPKSRMICASRALELPARRLPPFRCRHSSAGRCHEEPTTSPAVGRPHRNHRRRRFARHVSGHGKSTGLSTCPCRGRMDVPGDFPVSSSPPSPNHSGRSTACGPLGRDSLRGMEAAIVPGPTADPASEAILARLPTRPACGLLVLSWDRPRAGLEGDGGPCDAARLPSSAVPPRRRPRHPPEEAAAAVRRRESRADSRPTPGRSIRATWRGIPSRWSVAGESGRPAVRIESTLLN